MITRKPCFNRCVGNLDTVRLIWSKHDSITSTQLGYLLLMMVINHMQELISINIHFQAFIIEYIMILVPFD